MRTVALSLVVAALSASPLLAQTVGWLSAGLTRVADSRGGGAPQISAGVDAWRSSGLGFSVALRAAHERDPRLASPGIVQPATEYAVFVGPIWRSQRLTIVSPIIGIGMFGSLVYNSEARLQGVPVSSGNWRTSDAGVFLRGGLAKPLGARLSLMVDTHLRVSFVTANRRIVPGGGVGLQVMW